MIKEAQVVVVISILFSFISCQNKNQDKNRDRDFDISKFSVSIEDDYILYVDSINAYNAEQKNIPDFIETYHSEIEDRFKGNFSFHGEESQRKSIYSLIFERSNLKKLTLIKKELMIKSKISKHDSMIIGAIKHLEKIEARSK